MDNNSDRFLDLFFAEEDEEDYDLVYNYITNNPVQFLNVHKRKRNNTVRNKDSLWDSSWGKMLQDPRLLDPDSFVAKKFKRRFRFAYPAFKHILLPLCIGANVFNSKYHGRVPIEFKLLIFYGLNVLTIWLTVVLEKKVHPV